MNKLTKTLAVTTLLLSFGACTSIGNMKPAKKIMATKTEVLKPNQNSSMAIVSNTANEMGYDVLVQTPTGLTVQKDRGNEVGEMFGFGHTQTITITFKKTGNSTEVDFTNEEDSNTDKVSYEQTKKDLKAFVDKYNEDTLNEK